MSFDMSNSVNTLADNLMGGGSVAGNGFMDLFTYFVYFVGVLLAYTGLLKLHKRSEMSHQQNVPTISNVIITFLLSALLLSFGSTIGMLSDTLGMHSSLNYGSSGASGNVYINSAFRLLQFAGYIYVFVFFMQWYRKNAGDGQGITHGNLVTRLIAGTLLIHATDAIKLISSTLGIDISILGLR
jgi:hypothetical protein